MGLFDLFKKDKSQPPQKIEAHPEITVSKIDNGSHGDNIGGLIGFESLSKDEGKNLINEYMASSAVSNSKLTSGHISITDSHPLDQNLSNRFLGLRILKEQNNILSAFPYLKTAYTFPFGTKEIIEGSHMGHLEAEIKGGGRDTFGVDFFPTDYAVNKATYLSQKNINIHISAIALVVDKHQADESGEVKFAEDFVAYMPSSNLPRQTYYDFIGQVIEYQEVKLGSLNKGYIAKVRLINEESNPDFFTVDMFMNEENMRIQEISNNMKITGMLWFQGELAQN